MDASAADPVLVIKLGALGDFIQALGPLAAIRRHHPASRITLLTTAPFVDFAKASGYADEVWCDEKPSALAMVKWLKLRKHLRLGGFGRVYDLQTSDRSAIYYRLFWPGPIPEWSGSVTGSSFSHTNPGRDSMHTIERQAEQLRMAGIENVRLADVSWATGDIARFGLADWFALLVPGGAIHRPGKRWPQSCYGELAEAFLAREIQPVLLGVEDEAWLLQGIAASSAGAVNLAGRTDLMDIAELSRRAVAAVGNDTGPMHLIAAAGCPCIVLYSHESDPALCAQRGAAVSILRRQSLDQLSVDEVLTKADALIAA